MDELHRRTPIHPTTDAPLLCRHCKSDPTAVVARSTGSECMSGQCCEQVRPNHMRPDRFTLLIAVLPLCALDDGSRIVTVKRTNFRGLL